MSKAQQSTPIGELPIRSFGSFLAPEPFIIYLTGDGGWNSFSQQFANEISQSGYSLVVFDSRKYFWAAKTPEQFTIDFQVVVDYFLAKSKTKEFGLVGYSFGADVAAFLPANLSPFYLSKLRTVVLMSPGLSTDFEVKLADLIGQNKTDRKYAIIPELEKSTIKILCLFGEDEQLEIKQYLKESGNISVQLMPGGHRYDFDTSTLSRLIINTIDIEK